MVHSFQAEKEYFYFGDLKLKESLPSHSLGGEDRVFNNYLANLFLH